MRKPVSDALDVHRDNIRPADFVEHPAADNVLYLIDDRLAVVE